MRFSPVPPARSSYFLKELGRQGAAAEINHKSACHYQFSEQTQGEGKTKIKGSLSRVKREQHRMSVKRFFSKLTGGSGDCLIDVLENRLAMKGPRLEGVLVYRIPPWGHGPVREQECSRPGRESPVNEWDCMKLRLGERFERLFEIKVVEPSRGDDESDLSQIQKPPLPLGRHRPRRMHEQASVRKIDHRHAPAKPDSKNPERIPAIQRCVSTLWNMDFLSRKAEPVPSPLQRPSDESSEATASAPAATKPSRASVERISFIARTRSSLPPFERKDCPPANSRTVFR